MPNKGETSPLFQKKETSDELLKISYTSTGEELFSIHHGFWGTDGNFRGLCHTGCVDGMVANFLIFPQEKFSVAVLVNDENGWDISLGVPSLLTALIMMRILVYHFLIQKFLREIIFIQELKLIIEKKISILLKLRV